MRKAVRPLPPPAGWQRGSSVVTLLMVLPLLLMFLCVAVDLGRAVFVRMELENAVAGIRQRVEGGSLKSTEGDLLVAAAYAASPSLRTRDLDVAARVDFEKPREDVYRHRLYDRETGEFIERSSHTRTRKFEAVLTVKGECLTPIGSLVVPVVSGAEGFEFSARSNGRVDETVEGGGW